MKWLDCGKNRWRFSWNCFVPLHQVIHFAITINEHPTPIDRMEEGENRQSEPSISLSLSHPLRSHALKNAYLYKAKPSQAMQESAIRKGRQASTRTYARTHARSRACKFADPMTLFRTLAFHPPCFRVRAIPSDLHPLIRCSPSPMPPMHPMLRQRQRTGEVKAGRTLKKSLEGMRKNKGKAQGAEDGVQLHTHIYGGGARQGKGVVVCGRGVAKRKIYKSPTSRRR